MKKILITIIILLCFSTLTFSFAGGDGSAGDPYQITTWAELNAVRNNLTASYILNNNLGSGDADYATYATDWTPIGCGQIDVGGMACASGGSFSSYFTGDFNGGGYVISDLTSSNSTNDFSGFFGAISTGANISDLNLHNLTVTGGKYTGGIVGRVQGGSVYNVSITGSSVVTGSETYTGGAVAYIAAGGDLNTVSSTANVTGTSWVGGAVGTNYGNVYYAAATGNVTGTNGGAGGFAGINSGDGNIYYSKASGNILVGTSGNGGGFVGYVEGNSGKTSTVKYSYSTGDVNTTGNSSGGFAGGVYNSATGKVFSNCYSTGAIYANNTGRWYLGGFVGGASTATTFIENSYSIGLVSTINTPTGTGGFGGTLANMSCSNNFWDTQTSGTATEAYSGTCNATGKTTLQMNTQSTFTDVGWDFTNIWAIDENINNGYPYLLWQTFSSTPANNAPDLNITQIDGNPDDSAIPAFYYLNDGNLTITFSVMDADENDLLYVDISYSNSNIQGSGTLIVDDLNLSAGLACDDTNFLDSTSCNYDWNISGITDGNYYILIDLNDVTTTTFEASDNNFGIDSSAPNVVAGYQTSWYAIDTNITLTCTDSVSGCTNTYYRVDLDTTSLVTYGAWQTYSSPIPFTTDGNYALDFNGINGINLWDDINTIYILMDQNLPTITTTPDQNIVTVNSTYNITYSGSDTTSGIKQYFVSTNGTTFSATSDTNYLFYGSDTDTNILYVKSQDNADNNSQLSVVAITFDLSGEDVDADGVSDTNDTLDGNVTNVTTSGVTDLNILINGQTASGTYTGLKDINIFDASDVIIEFDHNFSSTDLNTHKISITKTSTSIIINLGNQLQADQNKTIYINDPSFVSLCVKDAEITTISEISSTCTDTNEYNFTSCLGGTQTISGIICTDLGSTIKIQNLRHSAAIGTLTTPSNTPNTPSAGGTTVYSGGPSKQKLIIDTNNPTILEKAYISFLESGLPLPEKIEGLNTIKTKRLATEKEVGFSRRLKIFSLVNSIGQQKGIYNAISIFVENSSENMLEGVEIVESLPKEFVELASQITSDRNFEIVEEDPIIRFLIGELAPGEKIEINYDFNKTDTNALAVEESFNTLNSPIMFVSLNNNDSCLGVLCNDSNPCTSDGCSEGECVFVPKCNVNETCNNGKCKKTIETASPQAPIEISGELSLSILLILIATILFAITSIFWVTHKKFFAKKMKKDYIKTKEKAEDTIEKAKTEIEKDLKIAKGKLEKEYTLAKTELEKDLQLAKKEAIKDYGKMKTEYSKMSSKMKRELSPKTRSLEKEVNLLLSKAKKETKEAYEKLSSDIREIMKEK